MAQKATKKATINVNRELQKKLWRIKLNSNFNSLDAVINDMYNKCYPEVPK